MAYQENEKLLIDLDPRKSPVAWVNGILAKADRKSGCAVATNLVAALLHTRHPGLDVFVASTTAGYPNWEESGVVIVRSVIFHVATHPTAVVVRACKRSLSTPHHPVLLVPAAEIDRVMWLARKNTVADRVSILSIEEYVCVSVILMASYKRVEPSDVFLEIMLEYNQRLHATEDAQSLRGELVASPRPKRKARPGLR